MKSCLTRQMAFSSISGCLVEKPECGYAHKFGFSVVCRHPEHEQFHAHVTGVLSEDDARELYDALRRKRRDDFTANLDESGRKFFCRQIDFFGNSLTNIDPNGQY